MHGVPFSIKDFLNVKGGLTTFGMAQFAHVAKDEDCAVVAALR